MLFIYRLTGLLDKTRLSLSTSELTELYALIARGLLKFSLLTVGVVDRSLRTIFTKNEEDAMLSVNCPSLQLQLLELSN